MSEMIKLPCITSGSDVTAIVTLADDAGAVDLTGRSVAVFGETASLAGRVSAEITDAAAGQVSVMIEGTAPLRIGIHTFRVQINAPSGADVESIGLPRFVLEIV